MKVCFENIEIKGISTVTPSRYIDFKNNIELSKDELTRVIGLTGIEGVYESPSNQTAFDLNYAAANELIKTLQFDKSLISCIINVSQTREHILPQTSSLIENKLECSSIDLSFDLPIGCSGYVYGLFQACLLISSGLSECVLLTAGDTTRKITNPDGYSTNLLFGDAGSATIITKGVSNAYFQINHDGNGADKLIVPKNIFRDSDNEADGNLDNYIEMDGLGIFNFAMKRVPSQIKSLMKTYEEFEPEKYIFHQANKFLIDSLARKLKLDREDVPIALKNYGNTGPASIPLTITDTFHSEKVSKVLMSGFGVGLSWASCMIDLTNTNIIQPMQLKNY